VHRPDRERPRWVRDPDGGGGGHGGAEVRRVQPAADNGGERLETIGYPERRVDPCIQAYSREKYYPKHREEKIAKVKANQEKKRGELTEENIYFPKII
jgi:hypothetical protein